MKKRIISLVLVVATLFAMSSIAFSANAYSYYVLATDSGGSRIYIRDYRHVYISDYARDSLCMYRSPSSGYITSIPNYKIVYVLFKERHFGQWWGYVRYWKNEKCCYEGWVNCYFLC